MSSPTVTLEIAFGSDPTAQNPTYTDCSDVLIEFEVTRGRQTELDQIETGRLSLTLDNHDRRFDPSYTLSPFYPNVVPMRKVRLSATFSGTTYYIFTGYLSDWTPQYSRPYYGEVQYSAYDAFESLNETLITGTFPQESSGARVARVLESAGWPASTPAAGGYWKLGTSQLGTTSILGYGIPASVIDMTPTQELIPASDFSTSTDQSALSHLLQVADSELGALFVDGQGRFIFHDKFHRLKQTTSVVTFTDGTTGSASRINYAEIVPALDRQRFANEVRVTATPATTPATYSTSDATSVGKYLRRSLARSPLLTSYTRAGYMGDFLLSNRKTPILRFDSVMVEGHFDDNAWPHVLGREIGDRVTVEFTPPSTGVTVEQETKDCYIESITHRVKSPVLWETTYQLSAVLPQQPYWSLGQSRLGTDTKLAY